MIDQEKTKIGLLLYEFGDYRIETVSIKLSEETDLEFNIDEYILTIDDLLRSRKRILQALVGRCLGLAMNLIPPEDYVISKDGEFESQKVVTEETVSKIAGNMIGSFKEKITVSVIVVDPEREKIKKLLATHLPYDIEKISIGVAYDNQNKEMEERWRRMLNRILEQHIVMSYTSENGVCIEIGKDLYMEVKYIKDDVLSFVELAFYASYAHQLKRILAEKGEVQNYILEIINHERAANGVLTDRGKVR